MCVWDYLKGKSSLILISLVDLVLVGGGARGHGMVRWAGASIQLDNRFQDKYHMSQILPLPHHRYIVVFLRCVNEIRKSLLLIIHRYLYV